MNPCTLWYRYIQEERLRPDPWEFNHLEDGHSSASSPAIKQPEQQNSWRKAQWQRVHAWLTSGVPPRVVHYGPDEAG